jgi:thiamine-monophosphate kinase
MNTLKEVVPVRLSELGEFDLISTLAARVSDHDPRVVLGIGDDAAAVRSDSSRLLLATSDALVEGIHFTRQTTNAFRLGWKTLAVSVSDIAAMGGMPAFALVDLGLPEDTDIEYADEIYSGLQACADEFNARIIGGDTVSSPREIFIALTLLGEVEPGMMVSRQGAKPGDRILVTGTLGDSAAGLALLTGRNCEIPAADKRFLEDAHMEPIPRLNEGRIIASRNWATSMIDISDGLAGDLTRISHASGVGAVIYADKLPYSDAYRHFVEACGVDPLALSLHGGEDYQLAFTVPNALAEQIIAQANELDIRLTEVGRIKAEPGISIRYPNGEIKELLAGGYEHFTGTEKI